MKTSISITLAAALAATISTAPAFADPVSDTYKG